MWKLVVSLLVVLAFIYYLMLLLQVAGVIQFTDKKFKPARMFIPFYYWLGGRQEKPAKNKSKLVKPFKNNTIKNGTD
jgi:hypothetical protein